MDFIERRKYPRFPVHYDVFCEDLDHPSDRPLHAIAENASRTGIKIRFSGHIPEKVVLRFKILKQVDSDPIECYGKVIWELTSSPDHSETLAGVHITKIGWTETDKLITNEDI